MSRNDSLYKLQLSYNIVFCLTHKVYFSIASPNTNLLAYVFGDLAANKKNKAMIQGQKKQTKKTKNPSHFFKVVLRCGAVVSTVTSQRKGCGAEDSPA